MSAPSTAIPSSYRLAKLTGFHRGHIHRVLRADSGATLDCAIRIARAAGITLDELADSIYRDDRMMPVMLQGIDDRRAEWLSEEAKKRRQAADTNGANSGNGRSKQPSKRRRK